jgi:hypothetical protein
MACVVSGGAPPLGIQAPLAVDRRGQPAADAIATEFAALARHVVAFGAGHGPQPSVPHWIRTAGRGLDPAGDQAQRALCCEPASDARRTVHRPRSHNQWPSLPASRRFRAVGGCRAWAEDAGRRASSLPDRLPLRRLCERPANLTLTRLGRAPVAPRRSPGREFVRSGVRESGVREFGSWQAQHGSSEAISTSSRSFWASARCWSFLSEWFSIWRIRSRVTLNVRPTSSRVRGRSPPRP